MKDKFFVPYETAKQLKEKGCPQDLDYYWMVRGKEEPHGVTLHDKLDYEDDWGVGFATFIPAPTYHEVLDWLESKGICIHTDVAFKNNGNYWGAEIDSKLAPRIFTDLFPTREEALNAAILKALKLI